MSLLRSAKRLAPVLISVAAIAYLVATIDLRSAFARLDSGVMWILIPALLLYGALSLVIESVTLVRLVPDGQGAAELRLGTAARIKAATYLVNLIHYALGAGALSILLRRRTGISLAEAAGIVLLITMFDLGMLLVMVVLGITLISSHAPQVQVGLILLMIGIICGGFALLRAPFSLGPLDVLRNHRLFWAARTTPVERLFETGWLRLLFVLCFLSLGWATFYAFGLTIPLGDFLVNFSAVALVATLPAIAGIGPSQVGMVEFFSPFADRGTLLACSVALSAGMILLRAGIGLFFARELTREAYVAGREAVVEEQVEA